MGVTKVFYRNPHNYDRAEATREAAVQEFGPSLTVQSMAEDVDINVIMRRFGVTGKFPENLPPMSYGDFSEVVDFRSAQEAVIAARNHFMAMPAEVRDRFANDPQKFLEFCETPGNGDEMRRLGLLVPKGPEPTVAPLAPAPAGVPAPAAPGTPVT